MQLYHFDYCAPICQLHIVTDGRCIFELTMDTQVSKFTCTKEIGKEHHLYKQTVCWLDSYFRSKPLTNEDLPLRLHGTAFQLAVWDRLCRIPFGQAITYGQIADDIGKQMGKQKMSAQAIGQAIGANPIHIIVPCHRVIGASGKLTWYAGGVQNKQWLLNHEKIQFKP